MVDPSLLNLKDGRNACSATCTWLPCGSSDMAAGLVQTTLASSAPAAPPEYALPVPEPFWVAMPKAPAAACPHAPPSAAPTASPSNVFLIASASACLV